MIQFVYHTNTQMINILKKTAARCSDIAATYVIGRSFEGRELLVIDFSNNPGEHTLRECCVNTLRFFIMYSTE